MAPISLPSGNNTFYRDFLQPPPCIIFLVAQDGNSCREGGPRKFAPGLGGVFYKALVPAGIGQVFCCHFTTGVLALPHMTKTEPKCPT